MSEIINNKLKELTNAVSNLKEVVFSELVSWEKLETIKQGETVKIGNTINTKIFEDEGCQIFKTKIPPKIKFPTHWHNFKEQNLMLYGELECETIKYKKGDWMKFESLKSHYVKNNSEIESGIIVIFTK